MCLCLLLLHICMTYSALCVLQKCPILSATEFSGSCYPSISDLSNLIFLCGALITAYQKRTYPCWTILYKVKNMSCHKVGMIANGRTSCHHSRSIKMAFKIPHPRFLHLKTPLLYFSCFCRYFETHLSGKCQEDKKSHSQDIACLGCCG